ncbi:MAG: HEPN domain-containing protein [Caldisericia bacterium]|nr:HEPN domain-containing protein [Caldisericia bacterium]
MKREPIEEAKRWIIQAIDEFNDAEELRKLNKFYLALFHFQQAVEKAIKGYLYLKTESIHYFFTHSIDELLNIAIEFDKDFLNYKDAKKLDRYYIPTRYPNGLPGGIPSRFFDDPEEALEASIIAKRIIDFVRERFKL